MSSCRTEPGGARRRTAAFVWRALTFLAVALAAGYLLMRTGEISESLTVAHQLAWSVVILAVISQFLSYLSGGQLLRATLRQTGHTLSLFRATVIQIATSTLSMLPGGSVSCTPAMYRWTRNGGVPGSSAAVTGVVVALFNAASLLVFGLLSALLLVGQHRLAGNEAIAVAFISAGIVATIAAAILAAVWPPALRFMLSVARRVPVLRRTSLLERADHRIAQLRVTISKLRNGRWGSAVASATLNVLFDAATLGLVFYAAGARVGAATLLAGYGLPIMLGQASFLPGGLAVTEVSMSAVYISLGLRPSVVIASVVTYRLVSLWLPALAGLPLIAYLQLRVGRSATKTDADDLSPSEFEVEQPRRRAFVANGTSGTTSRSRDDDERRMRP